MTIEFEVQTTLPVNRDCGFFVGRVERLDIGGLLVLAQIPYSS